MVNRRGYDRGSWVSWEAGKEGADGGAGWCRRGCRRGGCAYGRRGRRSRWWWRRWRWGEGCWRRETCHHGGKRPPRGSACWRALQPQISHTRGDSRLDQVAGMDLLACAQNSREQTFGRCRRSLIIAAVYEAFDIHPALDGKEVWALQSAQVHGPGGQEHGRPRGEISCSRMAHGSCASRAPSRTQNGTPELAPRVETTAGGRPSRA